MLSDLLLLMHPLTLCQPTYVGEEFKDHPKPLKGDNDLLCLTKPDAIYKIHRVRKMESAIMITHNSVSHLVNFERGLM